MVCDECGGNLLPVEDVMLICNECGHPQPFDFDVDVADLWMDHGGEG